MIPTALLGTRCLRLQTGLPYPRPFHSDGGNGPLLVASDAHLVTPLLQAGKQGGVHLSSGNTPSPDGDVCSIPRSAFPPYLYFQANQIRWRVHDGGTEVATDVEHDRPRFACPGEVVHDYGATDAGVAAGFL